jgi:hypothetical protein
VANGNGHILYSGLLTTTAATLILATTAPTATTPTSHATITHGTICNTSALTVTVSLAVLPPGATADGTHTAISNYSLSGGDTLSLKDYLGGATLGYGDSIWVTASTANAITVVISGLIS